MDLHEHLIRAIAFSRNTFGPDPRQQGVCDHIRKELVEIEVADTVQKRINEWVDVVILGLDGAWRALIELGEDDATMATLICLAIQSKQAKNEARSWPDWRTMPTDRAIEHTRGIHD